jgi:hypothetical protein
LNLERLLNFVNLLLATVIVSSVSSKLSRYVLVADENFGRHDILPVKLFLYDKKEYSSFYFFDFDFRLIVFFLPYLQYCFWENPFGLLQLIDFLYFILHLPPLVLLGGVFIIL